MHSTQLCESALKVCRGCTAAGDITVHSVEATHWLTADIHVRATHAGGACEAAAAAAAGWAPNGVMTVARLY